MKMTTTTAKLMAGALEALGVLTCAGAFMAAVIWLLSWARYTRAHERSDFGTGAVMIVGLWAAATIIGAGFLRASRALEARARRNERAR